MKKRQPTPLSEADFSAPLNKALLRATDSSPTPRAFDKKLAVASEKTFMLLRSFVPAFYRDLAHLSRKRLPGDISVCMGDGHPGNFGFIVIDDDVHYVFNDLDDGGHAPVALDAVRYFTLLKVQIKDDKLARRAISAYVEALLEPKAAERFPDSHTPTGEEIATHCLESHVADDRFVASEKLSTLRLSETDSVRRAFDRIKMFSAWAACDVASYAHFAGGSAGLKRFWLLAANGRQRRVYEFKAMAAPAVDQLALKKRLPPAKRLSVLKKSFWRSPDHEDYFAVSLAGESYMVRNRTAMMHHDVSVLEARRQVLTILAQVGEMARLHGPAWGAIDPEALVAWLDESSDTLIRRWRKAKKAMSK